jgi:hypothetical protein
MLHRVEVDVIDVPIEVLLVTNCVFPITTPPARSPFALRESATPEMKWNPGADVGF